MSIEKEHAKNIRAAAEALNECMVMAYKDCEINTVIEMHRDLFNNTVPRLHVRCTQDLL